MPSPITGRIVSQLELALSSDCRCQKTLGAIRHKASRSGLTEAEIRAALDHRSFDIRTSALIELACALKARETGSITAARIAALSVGWTWADIELLEAMAEAARQGPKPAFEQPSPSPRRA